MLYKALKTQYEQSGTSAEFYARQNYDNARLSDHESVTDFLTALTNLVHLVNKELSGIAGRIEDQTITMRTIHSFPPCMHCRRENPVLPSPPLYHSFRAPAVTLSLIQFLDIFGLRNPWEP